MENLYIGQAELNKIKFIDDAIKNMLSDNQKLAIELKEKEKAEKRFKDKMESIKVERIMRPHDFFTSGNTVIDEAKEIEAGMEFYK